MCFILSFLLEPKLSALTLRNLTLSARMSWGAVVINYAYLISSFMELRPEWTLPLLLSSLKPSKVPLPGPGWLLGAIVM